jgi:tryptophan synthase alpha chain
MPHTDLAQSIRRASSPDKPALVPYLTAGFPTPDSLRHQLRAVAPFAAAIEIGVPFSDPMADGVTIQRSSRRAISNGVTLAWILDELRAIRVEISTPRVLMSYLNPLIAMGLSELARACEASGVDAIIIPDLPLEESQPIRAALNNRGVGLVQLVSPVTPEARRRELSGASDGFLYAVTVTGVTGGANATPPAATDLPGYLDALRAISGVPVCAGFGIRSRQQVQALAGHADGAIIGSALIDAIERGEDPGAFLQSL